MARDPVAPLLIRAAVRGAVDFRTADPREPHWWSRLGLVLEELRRLDQIEHDRDQLKVILSGLSRDDLSNQSRQTLVEAQVELISSLQRRRFPWRSVQPSARDFDPVQLKKDYESAFGVTLDSPEGQAAIAQTVAMLEKVRVKPRG